LIGKETDRKPAFVLFINMKKRYLFYNSIRISNSRKISNKIIEEQKKHIISP